MVDLRFWNDNYYVKLIHCNFDWSKSSLPDLDFINEYNEFTLNEYEISNNIYPAYVHYRFQIPPVKISGNYLLILYRDGDREQLGQQCVFQIRLDYVVPFVIGGHHVAVRLESLLQCGAGLRREGFQV